MTEAAGSASEDAFVTENFEKKTRHEKSRRWTVECIHCKAIVIHRDGRCARHTQGCQQTPRDARQDARRVLIARGGGDVLVSDSEGESVTVVSATARPSKKQKTDSGKALVTSGIGSFVDRALTDTEQDKANTRLLRWFIHGNVPFNQADNPFFRKFLGIIRPSYSPASRFVLTSRYLPAEEARAYDEDIKRLDARENLTYLMDGWEDIKKRSVYGCLLSEVGEYPVILALKELTGTRATSECLVTVADEAITRKHVNPSSIIAVCTDNPTVMQAYRRKWIISHPWIIELPCFMHGVNTIMGKVASYATIKRLITSNTKIVTFFNSSHYWGGQLEQLAKENKITRGLKKNTESRFYAVILQALSIQEHKQVLYALCSRDEAQRSINGLSPIRRDVISSVLEVGRWQLNEEFIRVCKPLVDLIGDTESRDVTLADCMLQLLWAEREIMKLSESDFEDKEFLKHAKETVTRYFHRMNTDLNWLALFLHPLCRKLAIASSKHSRTVNDAIRIALEIAEKWNWSDPHARLLIKDIQQYGKEEGVFKGGDADAIEWWKSVIGLHPLQTFAIKLMSIVPHAAEVERFFSNLGGVQSVKRSCLTVDHLESLGMLRNHYNRQLHENAIASGKDPRRHHSHMHITSKGINVDRADTLMDAFSLSPELEILNDEELESFALKDLNVQFNALEDTGFTDEEGDHLGACHPAVPVAAVYNVALLDTIRRGQLPSIHNSLPVASQAQSNEPWTAKSLLKEMGL